MFYSHVNYSVTKIKVSPKNSLQKFYSHVNYSVTKIIPATAIGLPSFYSHVNYSVTKISYFFPDAPRPVLQSRKLFSY